MSDDLEEFEDDNKAAGIALSSHCVLEGKREVGPHFLNI